MSWLQRAGQLYGQQAALAMQQGGNTFGCSRHGWSLHKPCACFRPMPPSNPIRSFGDPWKWHPPGARA